jgi:hypothetical protein
MGFSIKSFYDPQFYFLRTFPLLFQGTRTSLAIPASSSAFIFQLFGLDKRLSKIFQPHSHILGIIKKGSIFNFVQG